MPLGRSPLSVAPMLGVFFVLLVYFAALPIASVPVEVPPFFEHGWPEHGTEVRIVLHADLGATFCVNRLCTLVAADQLVAAVRNQVQLATVDDKPEPSPSELETSDPPPVPLREIYLDADDELPWEFVVSTVSSLTFAVDEDVRIVALNRNESSHVSWP